jgi:serine O-acetyltransferase
MSGPKDRVNTGPVETLAIRIGALGWHALRLYRLAHWLWVRGHRASALLVSAINRCLTGADIGPEAQFGPGLIIVHGQGTVIHNDVRAGRDCVIFHDVTLGCRLAGPPPKLGDRVIIYPGAKVLGTITIGDDARIGPNALVIGDVPAGATVKAPLAQIC